MMSKKIKKILLSAFMLLLVITIFNCNVINAAINDEYPGVDSVPTEGVADAITGSKTLSLLAKLVFAVGRFLEWLMGVIFKMLTGYSDFPWADKIVFNAVPLLDINFINPSEYSFVASAQNVLKGLYSTIMTLAVGFFGIAVLITAIKLVITSIAAEKAKYKKAITQWLIGFVTLFCIHYFISFVFYLNEQLVVVASEIVTDRLDVADKAAAQIRHENISVKIIQDARTNGYEYNGKKVADILSNNQAILGVWVNQIAVKGNEKGLYSGIISDEEEEQQYINLAMMVKWAADENVSIEELREFKNNIKLVTGIYHDDVINMKDMFLGTYAHKEGLSEKDLKSMLGEHYEQFVTQIYNKENLNQVDKSAHYIWAGDERVALVNLPEYSYLPASIVPESKKNYFTSGMSSEESSSNYLYSVFKKHRVTNLIKNAADGRFYWSKVLDEMIMLKSASITVGGKDASTHGAQVRIITDLASYFRDNAYDKTRYEQVGVKDNKEKAYVQNMIMYAVLVGQSLILFIAYIKRLFYVIMLAMISPVVVVVDFFQKFGK